MATSTTSSHVDPSDSRSSCPQCGSIFEMPIGATGCPVCLLRVAAFGTDSDSLADIPWIAPASEELAADFPQLEIMQLIGQGGMGAVYKARQKSLGRAVALKILAPQHAAKQDFAERFSREAQTLAEVNHPNIVTVHDFGKAGQYYFLLMEFVDGVNLRQAMSAGRLTPEQALAIVPPICEALQFAHERGIVHRDIKPENLLLDKEGRVKIADFGIARMMRTSGIVGEAATPSDATSGATDNLTQGQVFGTPRYMSPEQRDRPTTVDHRADIYSLGVVLYEMLTGEVPGPDWQPPSRKSNVEASLDEVVFRALDHNPELRYQTAADLRTQILAARAAPPGDSSHVITNQPHSGHRSAESESDRGTGRSGGREIEPRRRSFQWPSAWVIGAVKAVIVLLILGTIVKQLVKPVTANVNLHDVAVDGSNFTCHYDVESPSGWDVWLTLANYQVASTAGQSPNPAFRPLSRYQTKLNGRGQVRIPLDFLPKTDEGHQRMRSAMHDVSLPAVVAKRDGYCFMGFTTDDHVNVSATLLLLPSGQSPGLLVQSDGGPRYMTVEPKPRPNLGPFEGAFADGKVELVALRPNPPDGKQAWLPDGKLTGQELPHSGGQGFAKDKVSKEIIIRVHNATRTASSPVLRCPSTSFVAMGYTLIRGKETEPYLTLVRQTAFPPELRQATFEVGIADGHWRNALTFDRHPNQKHFSSSSFGVEKGTWEGVVRIADAVGEKIPVSFSYSRRDDYETRLVYERFDGTIAPLSGEGSDGGQNLVNSITTMPNEEFETISKFHVQSRRYQWITFRNVSLVPSHRTKVDVSSAY